MAQRTYFGGLMYNKVPNASQPYTTPPTFAGITGLTANANGSLTVTWASGSTGAPPLRYRIYISTGSINYSNILCDVDGGTSFTIFQDSTGALLQYNTTYYVAVRAVDSVGNQEYNSAVLNATSSGVSPDSTYNLLIQIRALVSATL